MEPLHHGPNLSVNDSIKEELEMMLFFTPAILQPGFVMTREGSEEARFML